MSFKKMILIAVSAVFICATPAHADGMTLSSTDITEGGTLSNAHVYNGFGCAGENLSPHLSWSNLPEGTKSLAITAYDPDAPTGSGWWHWVAYNIPPTTSALERGASGKSMPAGAIEGKTDYGSTGFGGACPPQGDKPHRYIFTLYALNTEKIDAPADASAAMIGFFLHQHKIASASITATYGR